MANADMTLEVSVKDFPQIKAVMDAVAKKIATWDALCECTDEFSEDAPESCGAFGDADDAAMLELKAAVEKLVSETL